MAVTAHARAWKVIARRAEAGLAGMLMRASKCRYWRGRDLERARSVACCLAAAQRATAGSGCLRPRCFWTTARCRGGGFWVLTPLRLPGEQGVVLVQRGWRRAIFRSVPVCPTLSHLPAMCRFMVMWPPQLRGCMEFAPAGEGEGLRASGKIWPLAAYGCGDRPAAAAPGGGADWRRQ